MPEITNYFFKYFDEINNRLDENCNNPRYDKIISLLQKAKYSIVELGDKKYLLNIVSGKTPKGIHYKEEGIHFIGASNIHDGKVDLENAPHILKEIHETVLKSSQIKKNHILISMAGTIGHCAVYNYDEECNANQAVAILKINEDEVNPLFLVKYLNLTLGQLFFGKLQHISSQPNINLDEIGKIKIILPDKLSEQDAILNKIKTVEDTADIIVSEIEQIKTTSISLLLEFLDIGTEKFNNENYFFKSGKENSLCFSVSLENFENRMHFLFYHPKESLINKLLEKYSTTILKNIVSKPIQRGEQPIYSKEGITVIKTVDLKDGYIDYDNCLKVSEEFFEQHPNVHVQKDDILVSSTGLVSLGKVDVYDRKEPAMVDGHISILRLKEGYDPYFMTYFLRSILGKLQIEKWWTGSSGQIELQPYDLERFIIPDNSAKGVPLTEQNKIVEKIKENLTKIIELELKYQDLLAESNKIFENSLINS